uniref:DUF1795 domain-containing protein n=1 Tax=Candidatus Methanomethylicus mesodigestus TaxID=1867258 RepID=A0A7C3N5T7_9CREN
MPKSRVKCLRFSYYGFDLEIPMGWILSFDKKTKYESGIASFLTPMNFRLDHLWDNLEKYQKKNPTLESFMSAYYDSLRKNKGMKELQISSDPPTITEDHEILSHEISYTYRAPLGRAVSRKIIGKTIFCKKTNRFIAVYTAYDTKKENPEETALRESIAKFSCSCSHEAKL